MELFHKRTKWKLVQFSIFFPAATETANYGCRTAAAFLQINDIAETV